jgi:divalent metal cation (Fe/Co/Zn/Cd) transporter
MTDPTWNYVVLGAAVLFEGASFGIALRQFLGESRGRPFWNALHASKDPTTYTVLAEDSAALVGLLVAALGIWLSHELGIPELDGAASVVIGLLLAGVAVLLVRESRGLLIGEGIRPETAREIRRIATAQPSVRDVGQILSMYIGPQEVLVTLDLHFEDGTRTDEASAAMTLIGNEVRAKFPTIRRLFIEAGEGAA